MTAGRWPWKSAPAKECVTTHLPKRLALKMDGAQTDPRYSTGEITLKVYSFSKSPRVGGRGGARRSVFVRERGAAVGADLGSSSKHSLKHFCSDEGRCGEGFLVNCN